MYRQILEHYPVDVIVIGEGEITALELARAIEGGRDLFAVNGIAFKDNGAVRVTQERAFIEDLDTLPFPAHEQFDLRRYKKEGVDVVTYF
jgi:radical SAM superfamily enzyme YgiQ (UPF0313 family)